MNTEEILFHFILFPPFICTAVLVLSVPIDSTLSPRKVSDFLSGLLAAFQDPKHQPVDDDESEESVPAAIEPVESVAEEIETENPPTPNMSYQTCVIASSLDITVADHLQPN